LLTLGFLASPRWPAAYAISLSAFRAVAGVPDCTQCVSLPMTVARMFGWVLGDAAWVAIALGVLMCAWIAWRWRAITSAPFGLVSIGTLVTLLVSPYLLNYDYLLLLVPFSALAIKADSRGEWIALGLAYVLPAVALALWGAAGNSAFVASTLIVLVLTLRRIRIAG
jgi:hypothetical protein